MTNITSLDIRDAMAAILATRYPAVDLNPAVVDFSRRSCLLDCYRVTMDRITPEHYTCTAYLQVAVSVEQDAYGLSDTAALLDEQQAVIDLFRLGWIRVKDRAPRVEVHAGEIADEMALIDFVVRYVVPVDLSTPTTDMITDAFVSAEMDKEDA